MKRGIFHGSYILFKLALVFAAAFLLISFPGEITLQWMGYHLHMPIGVMIIVVLAATALLIVFHNIWHSFLQIPASYNKKMEESRQLKADKALVEGITAIAAGDFQQAQQLSEKALELNALQPLNALVSAQAAYMKGDLEKAAKYFAQMSQNPSTAFLGLRGLILHARQKEDWHRVNELLRKAFALKPSSPWVLQEILQTDILLQHTDHVSLADKLGVQKYLTKVRFNRYKALINWQKAEQASITKDINEFQKYASKALELAPDLIEVAVRLSDSYVKTKQFNKAQKILMSTYRQLPHPDLAMAWKKTSPKADSVEYYSSLDKLIGKHLGKHESLLIMAEAALNAKLWGQAREHLTVALKKRMTRRACRLMAELEEAEHPSNLQEIKMWWHKITIAENDAAWVCKSCQTVSQKWKPFCESCSAVDQIEWMQNGSGQKRLSPANGSSLQITYNPETVL
jgi:HemY protein